MKLHPRTLLVQRAHIAFADALLKVIREHDLTMSTPRVVHCKREPFDVYIGRACHGFAGSKWGNPFKVPKGYDLIKDPDQILKQYEDYLLSRPELVAALPELRGKVLGCWCAPNPCHGDVLLRRANYSTMTLEEAKEHFGAREEQIKENIRALPLADKFRLVAEFLDQPAGSVAPNITLNVARLAMSELEAGK